MKAAEFAQLEQAFDEAMSLPERERSAFVSALQRESPSVAGRLESMLHAHLERADAAIALLREEAADPSSEGRRVGRYRLLNVLGEGGWGVVYLAEQPEPVRRLVAVKVVKPGMDTQAVLARFNDERQALAMMDHPCVVAALDAGTTDDGRPYVVMPLVPGLPISAFCREERLSVRERVELFAQVCRGIEHAHAKGVIHRDLKPGNILVSRVDGVPTPRIIDFGLAKALERPLTPHATITLSGQVIGTPDYMSPEQADGLGADVRSDVYGLGALLYDLLADRPPFDPDRLRSQGPDELRRMIREALPERPSAVAAGLPRELDWITLRCLEKDPARRYPTAAALCEDVDRFLRGDQVQAGPPARLYRWWRWTRHHLLPVSLSAALVVVVIASGVGAAAMAYRERAARLETEEVSTFIRSIFTGLDPVVAQGRDRELLLLALNSAKQRLDERRFEPQVEAQLTQMLAEAYSIVDEQAMAYALAERSLALYVQLYGEADPRSIEAMRVRLDQTEKGDESRYAALAQKFVVLADKCWAVGSRENIQARATAFWFDFGMDGKAFDKRAPNIAFGEDLVADAEKYLGPSDRLTLKCMRTLARREDRDPARGLSLVQEARRRAEQTYGLEDPECELGMGTESFCISATAGQEATINYLKEHLPRAERLLGPLSEPVLIGTLNLGQTCMMLGRFTEAEPYVRSAAALANRKHGEASSWPSWTDGSLLWCCLRTGQLEEAQALDARLWSRPSPIPNIDAETYLGIVRAYDDLGMLEKADRFVHAAEENNEHLKADLLRYRVQRQQAGPTPGPTQP